MATRLFALPLLIQNLQSGEGNSTGHSGGGEANLNFGTFGHFSKLSAFIYLSTQRRGDNKKRCGKESPTMVIEGDEANKFNTILSFPISHAMMGNDKNRAERNAHHDDGGGETFRLRI